tara:strand:+ start:31 stop:558 length:528 start_codon:yes stop_codon:yes gene_type:complete
MMRISDIFLSLIGLIFLFPLLIILLIIVWIDIRSPFFLQQRIGLNKKTFTLIKFRTMFRNTKSVGTHLAKKSSVTKTGFYLRKTKLDELPQLFNVLIGDMSLVGPRPCLSNQKKLIFERDKLGVFKFRPGITGLAQIKGINMSTPKKLAQTDFKMIKKINLKMYFYYIFMTLRSF